MASVDRALHAQVAALPGNPTTVLKNLFLKVGCSLSCSRPGPVNAGPSRYDAPPPADHDHDHAQDKKHRCYIITALADTQVDLQSKQHACMHRA